MKPINFKEANKNLISPSSWNKEKHGNCGDLPTFTDGEQCISLWKMSWKERWQVFTSGKIWIGIHGGHTQPPIWLDTQKTVFKNEKI